jgi:hypothetical protein
MSLIYINPYSFAGIVTGGLVLHLDAGNSTSYPGSGTTWTDLSGRGNNATLTNGPTYSSANGGSIVFDGTNDIAPIGTSGLPTGASAGTLSAWAKTDALNSFRFIMSYGVNSVSAARFVGMSNTNRFLFGGFGNDVSAAGVTTNTWFNISGVYTGTNALLYINGALVAEAAKTWNTSTDLGRAAIGRQVNLGEFWDGNVSEALIYNVALSQSQITQNFNALRGRYGL